MVCYRDNIPVALADGVRDGDYSALLRLVLSQFRRLPRAVRAVTMIMGNLKTQIDNMVQYSQKGKLFRQLLNNDVGGGATYCGLGRSLV